MDRKKQNQQKSSNPEAKNKFFFLQMAKSQLYSQIFIYALTLALVAIILIYGYNALENFRTRSDQLCLIKFKSDLQSSIASLSGDFGSVKRKDLQLCSGYTKVCFVESFDSPIIPSNPKPDPIVIDSINSNSGKNVFLVQDIAKESFYAGKISVDPDILCVSPVDSKIALRLEGAGDHVLLDQWR